MIRGNKKKKKKKYAFGLLAVMTILFKDKKKNSLWLI